MEKEPRQEGVMDEVAATGVGAIAEEERHGHLEKEMEKDIGKPSTVNGIKQTSDNINDDATVPSTKEAPQFTTPVDEDANPSPAGDRPAAFKSTFAEVLFVLSATMAVAMTSFLTGGLSVVTSKIGEDLAMNSSQITWINASSSLVAGSFLLFFGRLADLFGRKTMFVGSLFLFAVFALAAGFAKTGLTFDILNGVMGLWSASAVPPAIGSLGATYVRPSKRKNYAFACFSAGNPLGFVFGSVFCGIATKILGWRAFLFLLAIIYLLFTIIAFFTVPNDTDKKEPLNWETIKDFDILGTILTVAGIGMLSAALSLAGDAPNGWKTPYVIALLIVGIVLLVIFVWWEHICKNPLMPMWIWRDRDFSLLLLILFIGFGSFGGATFWITLYIQRFWTNSSLMVAVYILPMAIMGFIVNIVAGLILHRVSNKLLMGIGAACYTISFLLLAVNRTGVSYWALVFPSFLLNVWGADLEFNVANMYVMATLPQSHQSTGGSVFQTVTRLSNTIILGITTAIFNAVAETPSTSGYHANDPIAPYAGTFWFSSALCAFSVLLVPFLRVGTQGNDEKREEPDVSGDVNVHREE